VATDDPPAEDGTYAALEAFVQEERLRRLVVVRPRTADERSYVESVLVHAGRPVPDTLADFEERVAGWCDDYRARFGPCRIVEIDLQTCVYVFDLAHERVVVAYGVSTSPVAERDKKGMRQYPDVNVGVRATLGDRAFVADRGHFLSHAAGGDLDVNLFPHRRALNQGRSPEGRQFRAMERYTAKHLGTFHFHRAEYDDLSCIPATLEYGVLRDDRDWQVATFANKGDG